MSAVSTYNTVKSHIENIKNDAEHTITVMSPGDAWMQGDVAIIMLAALPDGCKRATNPSAQLAPGNTQGSRHIMRNPGQVTVYERTNASPLDGPVLDAPNGLIVDHPEHGNACLPPGVFGIVYERAYDQELRRVAD